MQVIAHRGFADEAPENTVAAVEAASEVADAVEIDVRRCGSGELVVFHDETVDRVTDATGRLADYGFEALRSLRVCGSDQRIPTLSAVLDAAEAGTPFHVELKESGLAADVLTVLDGVDHPATLSSFQPPVVEEIRSFDAAVPTAFVASRLRDRPVHTARRLDCAGVHLNHRLCLVPGVVPAAKAAGLTVNAWTPRRRAVVRLLARLGVDGVVVDSPRVVPVGLRDGQR